MGATPAGLPHARGHRSDRHARHRRTGFLSGELHKRENSGILAQLRTAILRGLRPTTLLLNRQPRSKWNDDDRLLLQAYQIFEDENSKSTGLPVWLTRSMDTEIGFIVETYFDGAQAALDDWDKTNSGDKKRRGVSRYAVPVDANEELLEYGGLTRLRFKQAAIQEAQDREDGIDIDRVRPEGGYNPADYGDGVTDPA